MEYNFYSILPEVFVRTIAKLVEKVYMSGNRVTIYANERERIEELDSVLWTFSTSSFVPHGVEKHDYQHVMLTTSVENANNSSVFISVNCIDIDAFRGLDLKRCVFVFDTSLEQQALELCQNLRINKHAATYWKQTTKAWEQVL